MVFNEISFKNRFWIRFERRARQEIDHLEDELDRLNNVSAAVRKTRAKNLMQSFKLDGNHARLMAAGAADSPTPSEKEEIEAAARAGEEAEEQARAAQSISVSPRVRIYTDDWFFSFGK